MRSKIKILIKKVLGLKNNKATQVSPKYPIIWHNDEFDIDFKINNGIEDFRLRRWGGEKEYVIDMMNSLKSDDIFYDIGSSVGLMSIISAKSLSNGTVISFEPDRENYSCLLSNYKLNKLTNFKSLNLALGDKKDVLKLYTSGSNGFSPSLEKVNGIDSFVEIEVDTIDNLIKKENLPFPTVVKIDIEGAEFMAIKGMNNLLSSKNKPRIIFVELHPEFLPSFKTSVEEILEYLSTFDYSIEHQIERDKQILCKLVRIS